MDTIGLLAAWAGTLSFLIAVAFIVATSRLNSPFGGQHAPKMLARLRPERPPRASSEAGPRRDLSNLEVMNLVFLFGTMIRDLIFGATVVVVSIQILDLGPALLAAALPFSIDAKLITRLTGIFLFLMAFLFVFRLGYLAAQFRRLSTLHSVFNEAKTPAGS